MKNTKTPLYLIIFILASLLSISLIKTSQMTQKPPKIEFIEVRDTLTEIKWDTITLSKEKTVLLPVKDTLYVLKNDTLTVIDSVEVLLPINRYEVDTTLTTDTTTLNLSIIASGYEVSLDTLTYNLKYTTKKRTSFGIFAGPMVGFSLNGKPSVGVGVGVGIFL
jgi:hypothetical protein